MKDKHAYRIEVDLDPVPATGKYCGSLNSLNTDDCFADWNMEYIVWAPTYEDAWKKVKDYYENKKDKNEAIKVLQRAGIMDEKGRIIETYKNIIVDLEKGEEGK